MEKIMKWIPVSERLPEVGISTLGAFKHCTTGKRIIGELTRVTAEDHTWESDNHEISFDYDVTHWMPHRRTQTMRLWILNKIIALLLPKNVWVRKHFGAYSQKYTIQFGVLDNRGVLQGISAAQAMNMEDTDND